MKLMPRCHHCGDVIGTYEPMIVVADGETRNTSRAAELATGEPTGECYHQSCYAHANHDRGAAE
jgi:hypothetical protein